MSQLIDLLEHGALVDRKEDPSDVEAYRAALIETQAIAANHLLVAEVNGVVVGMCELVVFRQFQRQGGRCAEIESVHVHPNQRSKGIGRQLLSSAVETKCAQLSSCAHDQVSRSAGPRHRRLMVREAKQSGLDMSVRRLLSTLGEIEETVLLYQGERGRPRARRMLTEMDPTQQRLYDLSGLDKYAPRR